MNSGPRCIGVGAEPNGLNINDRGRRDRPQPCSRAVVAQGRRPRHRARRRRRPGHDGRRRGTLYDGDQLLYVIARSRLEHGGLAGVVGTLMSNLGLRACAGAAGRALVRAKVGDRYVLETLQERGWKLGGENSGHIICLDRHSTGDGIVAALQVLAALRCSRLHPGGGLRRHEPVSADADERQAAERLRLGRFHRHQGGGPGRRSGTRRQRARPAASLGHRAPAKGDGGCRTGHVWHGLCGVL
jgi:hypothetical protein